jgi:PTH1 family peptidyl-tRNA hydrolase
MDLPLSTVRIRLSGSSGGHKGMKSVIEHLGTDEIKRLRIGIGHAESDVIDYVLTPFSKTEFQQMKTVLDKAPYIIADYLEKGIDYVMNNYNG